MDALVDTIALPIAVIVLGVVSHELLHVLVLRLSGAACTVEVLPDGGDDRHLVAGLGGPLVHVDIEQSEDVSPRHLRIAALVPFALAFPLVLIVAGVLPNPFLTGSTGGKLMLIGWVACSIPSPQDFSLAWYPARALAAAREGLDGSSGDAPLA